MKKIFYHNDYVRIKIWGNDTSRFLDLCAHKQIILWNIVSQGTYLYANMKLVDFYQCKKIARKARIRAVVVERHGLSFFLPKLYKRGCWMIGCILFCMIVFISSNMLLHIRIYGNYSISEDIFLDFLKEEGIHIGMLKRDIPMETLEKSIRNHFDAVTWTSGKINGTILEIYIKENEKSFYAPKQEIACIGTDIYATHNGVVASIYVRNGVPLVKKGDQVTVGQKLVEGRVPVYSEDHSIETYQYYISDADIMIETKLPVLEKLSMVYYVKEYTGRSYSGTYIHWKDKILKNPLKHKEYLLEDTIYEPGKNYCIGGYSFGYGSYITNEYINMEKEYTQKEATAILEDKLQKNIALLKQKGVQILENNVTISVIMDNWTLSGEMSVIMPAFEEKPIEISEELNESEGI